MDRSTYKVRVAAGICGGKLAVEEVDVVLLSYWASAILPRTISNDGCVDL